MMTEQAREHWNDPEYRQMMAEQTSEQLTWQWADPEFRQRQTERAREQAIERWADPEYKQTMTEQTREQWADPNFRERIRELWNDPDFRQRMIEIARGRGVANWKNPEYRQKQMARPHITDFFKWLAKFPREKQIEIMKAIKTQGSQVPVSAAKDWINSNCKFAKSEPQLTPADRDEIRKRFGEDLECSFAKDDKGFYCKTHRARSKSYPSIAKIPQSAVDFIGSTG